MITIITKDYCPYCQAAKDLITSLGYKYQEEDVTNNQQRFIELINISGLMTVPQIFAGEIKKENCLGGYSDIKKLHDEGILLERLQ